MSKLMRMLVFFDLPVTTKDQRRADSRFRSFLLGDGYHMVQFSVYARICNGMDSVATHRRRLCQQLPPHGSVRLLVITEKQYSRLEFLVGRPTPWDEPQEGDGLLVL